MKVKKAKIYLLLIILSFLAFACKTKHDNSFQLYRFVDHLQEENVMQSPLKDIVNKFPVITQDLTGKWTLLKELSDTKHNVWAASTDYVVLGNNQLKQPDQMRLTKDGKEILYSTDITGKINGWHWIVGNEKINLDVFPQFNSDRQGIIIPPGKSFEFNKILPDDSIIMDLYAEKAGTIDSDSRLFISFNNNYIQELVINKKFYRIEVTLPIGTYKIKFQHESSNQNKDNFLVLGMIKIISRKDVLLLVDSSPHRDAEKGKHITFYHTYDERVIKNKYARYALMSLYNTALSNPIYDKGINGNPYSMKQKVLIGDTWHTSLFAPANTKLVFTLHLPSPCMLEFSYGYLPASFRKKINPVRFIITIEADGKNRTSFSKLVELSSDIELPLERINLSDYAGKKITFTFITENGDTGKESNAMPIWINPLLYRASGQSKPNVILISLDTLRPDHLSCYGYKRNTSPHIDALAQDGVLFRNVYSSTSWTLPAHVSMLTSLYAAHHEVYYPLQKINSSIITLADMLRTNHYYCSGLTGGGYLNGKFGFAKGFDSYLEFRAYKDVSLQTNEAELMMQKASQWLDAQKDKQFFLFVHTYQPHNPYANSSSYGKMFLSKNDTWKEANMPDLFADRYHAHFTEEEKSNIINLYDGEIRYTDEALIKPLIEKLKALNLYSSTLIVLTSDHGEEFDDHGAWLHDHSLYNEALRIPLIVKFPDNTHKNTRIAPLVRLIDIMPSILEYLVIKYTELNPDGKDFLSVINGTIKTDRQYISDLALNSVYDIFPSVIAINKDNLKLIVNKRIKSPYINAVDFNGNPVELYDMSKDPGEKVNLARMPGYRAEISKLITQADSYTRNIQNQRTQNIEMDEELKEKLRALGYIK